MADLMPPQSTGEDAAAADQPPPPAPEKRKRVKREAQPCAVPEDDKAKKEGNWLFNLFGKLADEKIARIVGMYIDMALRFLMALLFFILTRGWLYGVLELMGKQTESKTLQDSVLIALLTTTTINVLALLTAVAFYLFPRKPPQVSPMLDPNVPPPPM